MKRTNIFELAMLLMLFCSFAVTNAQIMDIESKTYKTVIINNLEWTAENLNVEHYRNGDLIPQVKDKEEWSKLTTGAWCYYDNDTNNGMVYGKIYNWYAVNDPRGLSPEGWHIATDSEWDGLIKYLGDYLEAGGKIKANDLWESPNKGATNESGFTALPSGLRYDVGEFNFSRVFAYFWTSSESDNETAWAHLISYKNTVVFRFNGYKKDGYAVRCVKDY
ncbi:MAG: fibrobacter succinogenes major paralogous domain-containing protein [Ignavibacteriae bacterium]|nr:fibrobacter succinogenes major paralogous domain-containing protein [Ignavibacteriota bacterium]